MDYDDAVATFASPRPAGTPLPEVVGAGGPARRLRDACEPLAMHALWNRRTNDCLAALGLDFLTGYVWGRAASLGEPSPPVVAAVFAWFEPGLLAGLYQTARTAVRRERLLAVRDASTAASLAEVLAGDDPAEVADLLADAVEGADGTGRPLFSGLRGRGRPGHPYQRLWWACDLVREHRGDSHVAVANAAGIGPVEMNVLTECWIGMPRLATGRRADRSRPRRQGRHRGPHRRRGAGDRRRARRPAGRGGRPAGRLERAVHRGRRLPRRHPQTRRRLNGTPRIRRACAAVAGARPRPSTRATAARSRSRLDGSPGPA